MNGQRTQRPGRRGMTLAEITVATALVGIVLVTSLQTSAFVTGNRDRLARELQGTALAHDLLDEILALPLVDPETADSAIGLEAGENATLRSHFDDVGDFHLWTATPPETRLGSRLAAATGWTRSATVEYVDPVELGTSATATQLYRVEVTAQAPDGQRFVAVGLATDRGRTDPTRETFAGVRHWFELELTRSGETVSVPAGSRNLLLEPAVAPAE